MRQVTLQFNELTAIRMVSLIKTIKATTALSYNEAITLEELDKELTEQLHLLRWMDKLTNRRS